MNLFVLHKLILLKIEDLDKKAARTDNSFQRKELNNSLGDTLY